MFIKKGGEGRINFTFWQYSQDFMSTTAFYQRHGRLAAKTRQRMTLDDSYGSDWRKSRKSAPSVITWFSKNYSYGYFGSKKPL